MMLWSRPTASDCASASACWNREVSLSIRMGESSELVAGVSGDTVQMRLLGGVSRFGWCGKCR